LDASKPTVINCIFSENAAGRGGAIGNWDSSGAKVINCTFYNNGSGRGGAIYNRCVVSNCILWGNQPKEIDQDKFGPDVTYSDIAGGWRGQGNVDADPCFVRVGYWADPNNIEVPVDPSRPNAVWIDGDYHLKSQGGRWDAGSNNWHMDDVTSPCIDAGDPNSPVGDEPFPNGGRINMGAYGGTAEASKSYFGGPICKTIVAGDINGDCRVDFADLAIIASHWLWDADVVPAPASLSPVKR
jgi:hypothetical protein